MVDYRGSNTETIDRLLSLFGSEHFSTFEAGEDFTLSTMLLDAKLSMFKLPSAERYTVNELLPYITNLLDIVKSSDSGLIRVSFEMDTPNDIKCKYSLGDDSKLGRELSMGIVINVSRNNKDTSKYLLSIYTTNLREDKYRDQKRFIKENRSYKKWIADTLSAVNMCLRP